MMHEGYAGHNSQVIVEAQLRHEKMNFVPDAFGTEYDVKELLTGYYGSGEWMKYLIYSFHARCSVLKPAWV